MDVLNTKELELGEIYDGWELGQKYEENQEYSEMFRMGFPDEYLTNGKPLLMYVGQEVRDNTSPENKEQGKNQYWVRRFTTHQLLKADFQEEGVSNSPFWNFSRRLQKMNYNVVWNNLDKFHKLRNIKISAKESRELNAPYGEEKLSILQREIDTLKPNVIIFVIGKSKYTKSLASAFEIDIKTLREYEPTLSEPVHEITEQLNLEGIRAFWSYHPAYLQRKKLYCPVLKTIRNKLENNSCGASSR